MFGKPEWFREKTVGWGVVPVSWQGWAYTFSWAAVIGLPFLLMLSLWKVPEGLIWMAASMGALTFDVRSVVKQLRQKRERDELFFIGEEPESSVSTENFDLEVRQESHTA